MRSMFTPVIYETEKRDTEEKRMSVYYTIAYLTNWTTLKKVEYNIGYIASGACLPTDVTSYILQDLKEQGLIDFKMISYDELSVWLLKLEARNVWCGYKYPTQEYGKFFFFLRKLNPELFWRLYKTPRTKYDIEVVAKDLIVWARENNCNLYEPQGTPAFYFALGIFSEQYHCANKVFFSYYELPTLIEVVKDKEDIPTPPFRLKQRWLSIDGSLCYEKRR